jgi:hypothetical protein
LIPGPYIQTEEKMRQVAAPAYAKINTVMSDLLSYIAGVSS